MKTKKRDFLRKQFVIFVALALVAAIALPMYFFVIRPMVAVEPPAPPPRPEAPLRIGGEIITFNQARNMYEIAMRRALEQDDLQEIIFYNQDGMWSIIYTQIDNESGFALRRYNDLSRTANYDVFTHVPFDPTVIFQLIATFGRGNVQNRLEVEDEIDFARFGLAPEDNPNHVTIYHRGSDNWHRIYIGDRIPTGNGFYARYYDNLEGWRDAVYIVGASFNILSEMTYLDMMMPILSLGAPNPNNFLPLHFNMYRGLEVYFEIVYLSQQLNQSLHTLRTQLRYGSFTYYTSGRFLELLQEILRGPVQGRLVAAAAPTGSELSAEELAAFSIYVDNPFRQLSFLMPGRDALETWWIIGERTENADGDAVFYIYNPMYHIVIEVPVNQANMQFVFWPVNNFIGEFVYLRSIFHTRQIRINSTNIPNNFHAMGFRRIEEMFNVNIGQRQNADGSTDPIVNSITRGPGAAALPNPPNNETGTMNFQRMLNFLMSMSVGLEVSQDVLDEMNFDIPHIVIEVDLSNDTTDVLHFYLYDTTNAFFTLNGQGRFFVRNHSLITLLNNLQNVLDGVPVERP